MSSPANLKHPSEGAAIGAQVAKAVAWVSGVFSLVACISLIVNQIQIMQVDPLNDATLKALKAQIPKDLNNQQLRESVRNLSFMTRRSFFTNQTMMRATGLMLLFGVAIFLASMKTYVELRLKLPVPTGQAPREGGTAERAAHRWAVGAGAGVIVFLTLLLVFVSPPDFDLMAPEKATDEVSAAVTKEPAKAEAPKPEPKTEANAEAPKPDAPKTETTAPVAETKTPPPAAAPIPPTAWPSFRGPLGQGIAAHQNAPLTWTSETVAWKKPIAKPGTNSVVVWGDRVFVAGADEQSRDIYAHDAKTGDLLWKAETRKATGKLPKVTAETTYCPATMATDGERVYAVFATGEVAAVAMDGKTAWTALLGDFKNSYGHSSSLIVHGGKLFAQFDHDSAGKLIAYDARSGKVVWEKAREVHASWASPILITVAGQTQVVVCGHPLVTGHDPETGKILWQFPWMENGEVAPSPAFAAGRLIVCTAGTPMIALEPGAADVKKLWEYEGELPDVSSPVATDKYVLTAASGGIVTCLNAATGKMVWTHEYDAGFNASPVIVGERVYLTDTKGKTFVLKLGDKFEQLAENVLGEPCDATAAIPEGRIYLRTLKNLYCIGKDGK